MSKERFVYSSSKEFEALLKRLLKTFNVPNKGTFFDDLVNGKEFTLDTGKVTLFGRGFNSLESQILDIDKRFFSRTPEQKVNDSNQFQPNDFDTLEELIEHIHITDIENLPVKQYDSVRFSNSGDFGLTIFSKQYADSYLKILQQTTVKFDFEIAALKKVKQSSNSPFIRELRKELLNLPDNCVGQKGIKESGLTRKTLFVKDPVQFKQDMNEFVGVSQVEIEGHYDKHKDLVTVLTEATRSLDALTANKKNAIYCRQQIVNLMSEITNTKKLSVRTSIDYLIHLLSNINVVNYEVDKEALPTIKAFSSNMEKLNTQIREYHELAKSKKATAKALYQKAALVKYQLRVTAIKNYNLVKEFQSSN